METQNNSKIDIIKFLLGQTISLLGSFIVGYATIWYITLETKSGVIATIAIIVTFLPQIIVSLFAGVWADKYNKKKLIMCSDGMIAIATLILAIVFMCGIRNIWLIFVISAIRSFGSGIQMPAISSFIPCITPEDKLMKVNGIYSMVQAGGSVIAPILSGGLLAVSKVGEIYKLENILFIDVVTAIIGIGLLYTVKYKRNEGSEKKEGPETNGQFTDFKEGIAYLKEHKVIRKLLKYYAVLSFIFGPSAILNVLFVVRTYGEEVWKLTANEIFFGVGSVIGGVVITIWGGFRNRIHTISMACIIMALLVIGIGIVKIFIVYLLLIGILGLIIPFFNTPTTVYFQENVKRELQGRVFGFLSIVTSTAIPLSMVIFGPLADIVSIESIFIVTGTIGLIVSVQMYFNKAFRSDV